MAKTKSAVKKSAVNKPAVNKPAVKKPTVAKKPAAKPARAAKKTVAKIAQPTIQITKPVVSTPTTTPAPPPAPAGPAPRDEMIAPRDIARLTRYGERFGDAKIDVRMLPAPLPITSGTLAVCDPASPRTWRVFDRPVTTGQFRTMLSIARDASGRDRLAAVVVHVGRPPITKWTVAHYHDAKKPRSADQLPRCAVTSGWLAIVDGGDPAGPISVPAPASDAVAPVDITLADGRRALALPCGTGEFAAYWAIDANDKPICLVIDFDRFTQKDWKTRTLA